MAVSDGTSGQEHAARGEGGLAGCRTALEAHYAVHRTIPSMAGLARLWGYASKSSAARRVEQLVGANVLRWSADRRLAPGPAFRVAPDTAAQAPDTTAGQDGDDPLHAALKVWASGYDPDVAHSYLLTTRLLRVARAIEQGMARSAARIGLTSGDVLLLDALYRVGPPHRIAPTALKHYFLMSLAGVAKRVDRLEHLGFIARVPNPEDRRGLFIELTAHGCAALAELVEADRHSPHIVWPNALDEAEYRALLGSLARAEALVATGPPEENERS